MRQFIYSNQPYRRVATYCVLPTWVLICVVLINMPAHATLLMGQVLVGKAVDRGDPADITDIMAGFRIASPPGARGALADDALIAVSRAAQIGVPAHRALATGIARYLGEAALAEAGIGSRAGELPRCSIFDAQGSGMGNVVSASSGKSALAADVLTMSFCTSDAAEPRPSALRRLRYEEGEQMRPTTPGRSPR